MPAKNSLWPVLNNVDLLVAEITHLRTAGPHFRIVHRFSRQGSSCLPGEEVFAVFLVYRGHEYQLHLSLTQGILFEFLARHSHSAQSVRQIELGIRADEFCRLHAKNVSGATDLTRRIPRSSIKVHIKRMLQALGLAFAEAGIGTHPRSVIVTQDTAGNEVGYRLKATFRWTHIDLAARDGRPLPGGSDRLIERMAVRNIRQ